MSSIKRYKCKDQIKERVQLDNEFKDMFTELTLNYLLDHPSDFLTYTTDFFQALKDSKKTRLEYDLSIIDGSSLNPEDEFDDEEPQLDFRRNCIVGIHYNPEKTMITGSLIYPKTERQIYYLQQAVKDVFLFRILHPDLQQSLIDCMYEFPVQAGDVLIFQGTQINAFYIIESGTFYVLNTDYPNQEPSVMKVYQNGGNFGQVSLLYETPMESTIKAVTDGTLWVLEYPKYRQVAVNAAYIRRKLGEELIESVPLLKGLPREALADLSDSLILKIFSPKERIVKESDPADGVYIVLKGTVILTFINDCGVEVVIRQVNPNGHFGEMSLISERPRNFSAYASDDIVEVFYMEVAAFERILGATIDVLRDNICLYQQMKRKMEVVEQEKCFD